MRLFPSYKQEKPDRLYDVIVIGSGLGGMTTAALLSKEGKRVLVLEKHYTIGGFTHVFKRNDYEWDVGIHYVGDMHSSHKLMPVLFNHITDGQLQWADMGEIYDKIVIEDNTYQFIKGRKNFVAQLKKYFPSDEDHSSIDKYMSGVHEVVKSSKMFFAMKAIPEFPGKWIRKWFGRKFFQYSDMTTLAYLQKTTKNKKLIGVLSGQFGDYGLPPSQSSFAMHAIVSNHYFNGGYFPIGGSSKIAEFIYPSIKAVGGDIYSNAEVKEIIIEKGKACGVIMKDDFEIRAEKIVSNCGIINTFTRLTNTKHPSINKMLKRVEGLKPSVGHFCLYIGIKEKGEILGLPKSNFWIYPGFDHDANIARFLENPDAPIPVTYISFPSAKDPGWNERYPNRSTIEVITLAPFKWFEQWDGTRWGKRGKEYESEKERWSLRLLEELYKQLPQLRGRIDHYELSTPLSTKNFTSVITN